MLPVNIDKWLYTQFWKQTNFFIAIIFPNNVRLRDDQMFKSVYTSRVTVGKFSLPRTLFSKLLIGLLTPTYLTRS